MIYWLVDVFGCKEVIKDLIDDGWFLFLFLATLVDSYTRKLVVNMLKRHNALLVHVNA